MTEYLFCYGTLQLAAVQEANFRRALPMNADALPGFRVETVTIIDSDVIETSGSDQHPILRRSTNVADVVDGSVLELTSVNYARQMRTRWTTTAESKSRRHQGAAHGYTLLTKSTLDEDAEIDYTNCWRTYRRNLSATELVL